MRYRKFPKIDFHASVLGFGAMRLPVIKESGDIDEKTATEMIYHAIENGVNYIDTAYPYHKKMSEPFVGRILQNGYRDKVKIATKLPPWEIKQEADLDRIFDEQCKNLRTERIDFYLLHALNKKEWEKLKELHIIEWLDNKVKEGRIGEPGFSFHADYPAFTTIIDEYDWTFCQIQYNYMDIDRQAGTKGLRYAASKGLAVIVMEPLLGGKLVKAPPTVQKIWDYARETYKPVEWALYWLWNQPEVTLVLSGMSAPEQVEENLHYADSAKVGMISLEDLALFDSVRDAYIKLSPIPCTECGYCMPCPQGVAIPWNLGLYNEGVMYDAAPAVRIQYKFMPDKLKADKCTACDACLEKCPQQIEISKWIARVQRVLGEGADYPG
ncbi:MAG: aldo/keto reductase [Spirochaetales bacterium]|nr:aldo/keto reductase [Spirochaetales bacterium]